MSATSALSRLSQRNNVDRAEAMPVLAPIPGIAKEPRANTAVGDPQIEVAPIGVQSRPGVPDENCSETFTLPSHCPPALPTFVFEMPAYIGGHQKTSENRNSNLLNDLRCGKCKGVKGLITPRSGNGIRHRRRCHLLESELLAQLADKAFLVDGDVLLVARSWRR